MPGGNLATDNFEFLRKFMEVTDTGNAGLLDEKNRPTREADDRVTRALFAYFLRDELPERQERMLKSVIDNANDNNIVGLVKGVMANVASLARLESERPDYSLSKDIMNAIDNYLEYKRARSRGEFSNIETWLNQDSFAFDEGGRKLDLTSSEKDLVRLFDIVKSAAKIREFFSKYNEQVRQDTGGESLFSDMEPRTKAQILNGLVNSMIRDSEEQGTSANAQIAAEGDEAPSVEGAKTVSDEEEQSARKAALDDALKRKRRDIDDAVKVARKLFPQFVFKVYDSVDDMPPELRAALPHEDDVPEAANEKGRIIHIFADKMPSDPKEIRQRIMSHEIIGHAGLKQLMGKRYDSMLDSIAKGHLDDIMPIARQYGYDMSKEEDRREATEEWLAHIADIENPPSWFQQLVSKIRATLRVMFNIDWSDNDIKAVISEASRNLQKVQGAQGIRFMLSDNNRRESITKDLDWGDETREIKVVGDGRSIWHYNSGTSIKDAKEELLPIAVKNLKAQQNYVLDKHTGNHALRIGKTLYRITKKGLFHGADRRIKHIGPVIAYIGDVLNASVEVPIDASPWHYRIASVNFEQPEYVLLTSRTANNAEDVVDIQSLYAINARLSNDAQTVTSTIAAKSDNVNNIAHIKSVWQTVFSKNLLPHIADKEKKTNIFPTSDKSSREVKESQSDVDWSLTVEQPTALGPETDIERAEERRMLQAAAVTPIENLRAMRLPLLLELAKRLGGDVKAVDGISRMPRALGVFRGGTRQIEVLRRLAKPQTLGNPVVVPADKVEEQRQLWMDYWTKKGVPESEIEIAETPVDDGVRMEAIRHDGTLSLFRKVAGHEVGHLIDYNAGETVSHGNVLGTVGAMLKRYMAHVIGETPSTQVDRDRMEARRKALRKEAEANVAAVNPKPKADDKAAMQEWRKAVGNEGTVAC